MGRTHPLPNPFIVFATQNPIEQEGTYPLPEAQLDRFMFSLWVNYPSAEEEEAIVMSATSDSRLTVEQVFTLEQIVAFQQLVRRVPVASHVVQFAVRLVRASRPENSGSSEFIRNYLSWGAGPRATQYLVLAAKALAVIDGQPAVSVTHLKEAAPWVLRHRLLPNYNAAADSIDAAAVVEHLLNEVVEPDYS